jgi:hypothetical protein
MSTTAQVQSIGDVARHLGQPLHVVNYIIMSRGIQSVGRAGRVRLFDDEAVERIRVELQHRDGHAAGDQH